MDTIQNATLRARAQAWLMRESAKGLVSVRLNTSPGADPDGVLKAFLDAEDVIEAGKSKLHAP